MTDKEFAKEQYEQLKRYAEFVWQTLPDGKEKDAIIEEILIGMSEAKRRFNESVMKQVIDLIENPRIKDVFECYSKASSSEERQKIIDDYKRWFEKLSDEEKLTESTRQFESARSVIDGVKANNEELKARRIREKLGNVPEAISMSYVAKNYFGKTKTWLYQRLNGNKVNGKEACFTESEARQLQDALHDLGHRLSSIILI